MKKIFFLFLFVTLSTNFAWAQTSPCKGLQYQMASYENQNQRDKGVTPLFNVGIFNSPCFQLASKDQSGLGDYSNSAKFAFDLMVGVSIALAVILFTFGAAVGILSDKNTLGLTLSKDPNSIFNKIEGKQRMLYSIQGLLVILGAWLVVNTINPDLLRLPIFQGLYSLKANTKIETGNSSVKINSN